MLCLLGFSALPPLARGQAPPFLTNDPGTPGNLQWELNLGSMLTRTPAAASYQMPQIDVNFGVGERVQLTYEVPYLLQTSGGQSRHGAWGDASPGVKWRFLDQGDDSWQASVFPQLQTSASATAQRNGLGSSGPRYLLPLQVARKVGSLDLNAEAGYFFARGGSRERTLGLVAAHEFGPRLELGLELFDDRISGLHPHSTTLDVGGHYRLSENINALFMIGNGVNRGTDQIRFISYAGVQILIH